MKIAIISRTPLDGSPWELLKALRRYTSVEAWLVDMVDAEDRRWLLEADVVHLFDEAGPEVSGLIEGKPVIVQSGRSLPDIIDPDEYRPRRRAGRSVTIASDLAGIDYERRLDLIAEADVLVDDLVEGSWTRASLEGACFGCAVVNASGLYPFVHATPETLEERLLELVENKAMLRIAQEEARLWALQKQHAIDGVKEYEKAYREALGR